MARKYKPNECPKCYHSKGRWCYGTKDGVPVVLLDDGKEECNNFKPRKSIGDCHV